MSRYLQPGACLDCGFLGVPDVCPRCGLPQSGPEAEALRRALTAADDALMRLRSGGRHPSPPAVSELQPVVPSKGERARSRLRVVSVPALLLGLGALCVVVAAVVFVSVTWSDLSLAVRATILLGVTLALGVVARAAVRRRLRGSAEAFSVLFTILVAVDFAAARSGDLAGLGAVSPNAARWVFAVLLVVAGGAWAVYGARSEVRRLVGPQVAVVVGLAVLVALAVQDWPYPVEFAALLCAGLLGLAGFAAQALLLSLVRAGAVVLAVLCFAGAGLVSFSRLANADTLKALWLDNGAYGWLICCGVFGGTAAIRGLSVLGRIVAAAAALAGVTAVAVRPIWDAEPDMAVTGLAGAALALALLWVGLRGVVWRQGARLAALPPAVAAVLLLERPVAVVAAKCVSPALSPWTMQAAATPAILGFDTRMSPLVTALAVILLGATGSLLLVARLPSVTSGAVIVVVAGAVGVLSFSVPLLVVVAVLVGLTLLSVIAVWRRRRSVSSGVAAACSALALSASLGSVWLTALTALLLSWVFSALAVLSPRPLVRGGYALVSVQMVALAAAAWVRLLGGGVEVRGVGVVAVAAVAILLAQSRLGRTDASARVGVEAGAALALAAGLVLAAPDATLLQVALTVAGVATVAASLLAADRRWAGLPGGLLLMAATWVRLVEADVDVVEAYTLPGAVALLGVGAWNLYRRPPLGSVKTLAPGLSLALLPSLLSSLDSPASLRALILGGCALGVLLVGAYLRLAAPLVAGALVVGVLAVLNLAPLALALPRWVIFATVGAALLFLGMTWEKRLAELRSFGNAMDRLA